MSYKEFAVGFTLIHFNVEGVMKVSIPHTFKLTLILYVNLQSIVHVVQACNHADFC